MRCKKKETTFTLHIIDKKALAACLNCAPRSAIVYYRSRFRRASKETWRRQTAA